MERGEGDDRVEVRRRRFPALERADDDRCPRIRREPAARHRREPGTELDPDELEAARRQGDARLAGAGPDLDDPPAGRQARLRDEVVEQRLGIGRPRLLVLLGDRVEGQAQSLPVALPAHAYH